MLLCLNFARLARDGNAPGVRGKWIASLLGLKRKSMPSHHTYRRILAGGVDEEEFEELSRKYFRHRGEAGYRVVVSMDGKILRGTIDTEVNKGLCLLAVYLPGEIDPGAGGN